MAKNIELPIEATNPIQRHLTYDSSDIYYPVMYKNENLSVINECDPKTDGLGLSQQTSFIKRSEGSSTTIDVMIGTIFRLKNTASIRPYHTYYYKNNSLFTTALGNKSEIILPNGSSTNYWIASRCAGTIGTEILDTTPIDCFFSVRYVDSGTLNAKEMIRASSCIYTNPDAYPLFPVVTISSGQLKQTSDGKGYYIGDTEPITPDEPEAAVDVITAENYGDFVNYGIDINGDNDFNNDWQIFMDDGSNVYLIAADYVDYTNVPNTNNELIQVTNYTFSLYNMANGNSNNTTIDSRVSKWVDSKTLYDENIISYMLNTSTWGNIFGNSNAEYVVGSPTVKMFINAYNAVNDRDIECTGMYYPEDDDPENTGYAYFKYEDDEVSDRSISDLNVGKNNVFISNSSKADDTWMASNGISRDQDPYSYILRINKTNSRISPLYIESSSNAAGFRPVICLKSSVNMTKDNNGIWNIQ